MQIKTIFYSLLALFSGVFILLFLGENTLFLAALLLAVLSIKSTKADLDKMVGIWFSLSVAPAFGVSLNELLFLNNGFILQALVSFIMFLVFYSAKPSVIGRLYQNSKGNMGIMLSGILCGFAAGIVSAFLWQAYLQLL
jgi:phosphatidylglycerophosphatase A